MSEQRFVFLNHANPEDNAFTAWLGARLAGAGYSETGRRFADDVGEILMAAPAGDQPIPPLPLSVLHLNSSPWQKPSSVPVEWHS